MSSLIWALSSCSNIEALWKWESVDRNIQEFYN
jgi:hypothetical protein